MKNLKLSAQTSEFIYLTLQTQTLGPNVRTELFRLAKALDSKESFTVNANQMTSGQLDMICGIIRDVAKHTGYTFEEMKKHVKEQFGISGSFKDLSNSESIDLCDKIRSWVNQGE